MAKWDNKKEDCLVFLPKSVSMYYTLSTLNEAQILKLGAEIKIAQGGGKRPRTRKKQCRPPEEFITRGDQRRQSGPVSNCISAFRTN